MSGIILEKFLDYFITMKYVIQNTKVLKLNIQLQFLTILGFWFVLLNNNTIQCNIIIILVKKKNYLWLHNFGFNNNRLLDFFNFIKVNIC